MDFYPRKNYFVRKFLEIANVVDEAYVKVIKIFINPKVEQETN